MEPGQPQSVLAEVIRIAPSLHLAGTFSAATLEALVRHASQRPIHHSVETGSGASTLLFSHISDDHTVFAMDAGTGSIRGIEHSPLLRQGVVTFVEGPTQVTLPRHTFTHRLQLALIDGPHGYPFPDLEYYYLYPQLDPGALLIVDDIHIPTITNLFDVLRADDMFELQEVVETTGFLRRTDAPTFPPTGDGWWMQGYNKRAFEVETAVPIVDVRLAPVETPTPFYIDQFGAHVDPMGLGRLQVPHGEALTVAGWALDATRRQPAAAVDLVLGGTSYRARIKVSRADVAAAHGDQAYLRSGFTAQIPGAAITPGAQQLEIRVVLAGGDQYYPALTLQFDAV
jgi:hypothetical protein